MLSFDINVAGVKIQGTMKSNRHLFTSFPIDIWLNNERNILATILIQRTQYIYSFYCDYFNWLFKAKMFRGIYSVIERHASVLFLFPVFKVKSFWYYTWYYTCYFLYLLWTLFEFETDSINRTCINSLSENHWYAYLSVTFRALGPSISTIWRGS